MSKEEVVELMTDHIVNMNREAALQQGIDPRQAEMLIETMLPQLNMVNEQLYDLLVENGVI